MRAALSIAIVLVACGGQTRAPNPPVTMGASTTVPAAQGQVKVDDGGNGNTAVSVTVKHLAPPDRMGEGVTTYVVWAKPLNGPPQNLGALQVNENLEGVLRTVTPLREFDCFVTAEPSPTSPAPSGQPVLTAHVMRE